MSEPTPTLGERLRAAREAKALTAQKIADQLHLDAWVIEALESGDYARIGPAVYGKGHLKRYAGALGLPVADIVGAYNERASEQPELATPTAVQRMPSLEPVGGRLPRATLAGFAALALVVTGVYLWRPWQPRAATPPVGAAAKPVSEGEPAKGPVGDADWDDDGAAGASGAGLAGAGAGGVGAGAVGAGAVGASGAAANGAPAVAGIGIAAPGPGAGAAAAPAGEGDSTAGAGRVRLRLSFSADSWVDVRDATGLRLYAGQGRANSVRTIAGAAPMRVYLGFASGVQLKINNRVVAIGPQFVAGDVARFEAGADGVLRRDLHAAAADPHPRG
jgi:cytoskeleton protein RodZ